MGKSDPSVNTASPYAFRCMTPTRPIDKECDCNEFQPLFKPNDASGQPADTPAQEALIEQARCRGIENGLESGRKEACRIASSAVSPGLKALIHTLNDLAASNQQMKEQVSAKVVELALSISERIIGGTPRMNAAAMNNLKVLLGDTLSQLNRVTLHINPQDVLALEALSAADGIQWPDQTWVELNSDKMIPSGEVRVSDQSDARNTLDSRVLSALAELLARNKSSAV